MRGLIRVAACVPPLYLGDVEKNVQETIRMMQEVRGQGASLAVFPELGLTGASCGDLFHQSFLLEQVKAGIQHLADACPEGLTAVVGAPVPCMQGLCNAAVVICRGKIVGASVKTYLSNQEGDSEGRWFVNGERMGRYDVHLGQEDIPISNRLVFCSTDDIRFAVEIGEDLYAPIPPSTCLALSGAEIILNMAAVAELVGQGRYVLDLVRHQSMQAVCGYVYTSAGCGESTTDQVYGGRRTVCCCGETVVSSSEGVHQQGVTLADLDLLAIRSQRLRNARFADCQAHTCDGAHEIALPFSLELPDEAVPMMQIPKLPFIPSRSEERFTRCRQILSIQAQGLARRMQASNSKAVIGISGGLDSTLALLVACRAADLLGRAREDILGITMPCFGTSDDTVANAKTLMSALKIRQREIPIHEAVRIHFRDIGHEESDHSVTYENAQARERTQVLMDVANQEGALVVGTGDLSEIALGWCTYNGDHMSMYGVNGGVPKTLVRWIVTTAAEMEEFSSAREVLHRILDTPISPELLPPDEQGRITQSTEDLVGPYALHDFFLYHTVRYGFNPRRVYQMAKIAFQADFPHEVILKWLRHFYRRFFSQQFKRSCMPDGVRIGTVALSPRGGWRMPSDALAAQWLQAVDQLQEKS